MLAADSPALVVALLAGHRAEYAGKESSIVGGQIDLTGNGRQLLDLRGIAELEEWFMTYRSRRKATGWSLVDGNGVAP